MSGLPGPSCSRLWYDEKMETFSCVHTLKTLVSTNHKIKVKEMSQSVETESIRNVIKHLEHKDGNKMNSSKEQKRWYIVCTLASLTSTVISTKGIRSKMAREEAAMWGVNHVNVLSFPAFTTALPNALPNLCHLQDIQINSRCFALEAVSNTLFWVVLFPPHKLSCTTQFNWYPFK